MSQLIIKIRLIYLQFLMIAIGFIASYSFFIWLMVYRFELLPLSEDLISFWLPFFLPAPPGHIWLKPRIKLLFPDTNSNLSFVYYFAACLAISAPTIVLQNYLITATGKLTKLNNIEEITQKPLTKYYVISNHYIDKQHAAVYQQTEVSGRHDEYLTFHIYVASPILNKLPTGKNDSTLKLNAPPAWLGTEYEKQVSNRSTDAEKEAAYKQLNTEANESFNKQNLDQFIYLDRIGNNDKRRGYAAAIKSSPQYKNYIAIILEAKNEPFAARNGNKLGWVFKSFAIGAGIWFVMLLFPAIDKKQLKKLPEYSFKDQFNTALAFFSSIKINKKSPAFFIIIALNVLVFVVMVFAGLGFISFNSQDLYAWGANFRPAVLEGQWWRLLTNVFLHAGFMHILFNIYGLLWVSIFIEPILGRVKYVIAYILCGVLASLASIYWHPATISVGASGAIMGLYGVLTALLLTKKTDKNIKVFLLFNNAVFIGITLIAGLTGGIDNAAHIGGLLAGLMVGCVMYFFIETPQPKPKRRYTKRLKKDDKQQNQ
ncbi:rhomboid family intramembrane serine protease [Mucilaginibacter sp. KACC 22063]|uniref:rhomboid family intramembrane serine protease n=1 Tax=Mucilaginibacter sp. KACC 22063 TaxID=3025666 RepID=UPI00236604D4|nr:rhomboid family intramembrane serine protease [Mucilaginibacter sp. KACC 22063]WDF56182.1 rhomboid family intramembrane serine protease [Mucilaginibacter sp. KACC 22063]